MFVQQGRSPFGARSVHGVRERERREERQVCEPEGPTKGRERNWRTFSTSCTECEKWLALAGDIPKDVDGIDEH